MTQQGENLTIEQQKNLIGRLFFAIHRFIKHKINALHNTLKPSQTKENLLLRLMETSAFSLMRFFIDNKIDLVDIICIFGDAG